MYKSFFYLATAMVLIGCSSEDFVSNPLPLESHESEAPKMEIDIKKAYLDAINKKRATQQNCGEKGTKPAVNSLVWNDALYKAAYEHSEDLAKSDTFSHEGSGTLSDWTAEVQNLGRGSTYRERSENNGYINWKTLGENITAGTVRDTVEKAMNAWMKSDGHCANIMKATYTEVGMAHVEKENSKYRHYWTQNFGAR